MEIDEAPDVHSPDFPNSGVLKWMPDGSTVLTRMDRSTVKAHMGFLAYARTFGPYVGRLGLLNGKYLWQLPENESPFSLKEWSLDIFAMNDPYYQHRIVVLPTGFPIRTGINVPQLLMPGGAQQARFTSGDYPLTVNECLQLGILETKGND